MAQGGTGGEVDDAVRLLAELGGDAAGDDLDPLGDAGVERIREGDPHLVADRLAVDHQELLRVAALEVVAAVLVLAEAGRGEDDRLEGARGDRRGEAADQRLVDVGVSRGVVRLDLDVLLLGGDGRRARELRGELDLLIDRHGAAHLDVGVEIGEPFERSPQMIRIVGDVVEDEAAVRARDDLLRRAGEVVCELHAHAGERLVAGSHDLAADLSGPGGGAEKEKKEKERGRDSGNRRANGFRFHWIWPPSLDSPG